jgi:hypothetical protein
MFRADTSSRTIASRVALTVNTVTSPLSMQTIRDEHSRRARLDTVAVDPAHYQ